MVLIAKGSHLEQLEKKTGGELADPGWSEKRPLWWT